MLEEGLTRGATRDDESYNRGSAHHPPVRLLLDDALFILHDNLGTAAGGLHLTKAEQGKRVTSGGGGSSNSCVLSARKGASLRPRSAMINTWRSRLC